MPQVCICAIKNIIVAEFDFESAQLCLFTQLRVTMHLMYTLDDKGDRVYTLKVRLYSPPWGRIRSRILQKLTDAGKITKSAHPGMSVPSNFHRFSPRPLHSSFLPG